MICIWWNNKKLNNNWTIVQQYSRQVFKMSNLSNLWNQLFFALRRLTPQVGLHLIHTHAKTWHQARNICREEGGDLAVINSPAESQALAELMAKSLSHYGSEDSNYVLIGFNDIDQEGEYVTIDGRSLNEAGFAEWATNEPGNPGTGENCGSIYKDGRLNDISCEVAYGFACELPMLDQGSLVVFTCNSIPFSCLRQQSIILNTWKMICKMSASPKNEIRHRHFIQNIISCSKNLLRVFLFQLPFSICETSFSIWRSFRWHQFHVKFKRTVLCRCSILQIEIERN